MKTKEIYSSLLREVIRITDCTESELMTSHEQDKVEARVALVDCLYKLGMRDALISHLTGINKKTVNRYHNSSFSRQRQSFPLRCLMAELEFYISTELSH